MIWIFVAAFWIASVWGIIRVFQWVGSPSHPWAKYDKTDIMTVDTEPDLDNNK